MKEIASLYQLFLKHRKVSTDSRGTVEGSIFFALSGASFNGNRFAQEALDQGAVLAVVDDPEVVVAGDPRFFIVPDTLAALQDLALYHRQHFQIPILAITGSNGKTTTKELISAVLKTEKEIVFTRGNLNNHIGVPLTLLDINYTTDIAVVEMGANHVGEIKVLCDMAKPTHGIITNIGKAHLEGFGSYEGVIKAKTELYASIRNSSGSLFVNQDDPLLMKLSDGLKRITYGKDHAHVNGVVTASKPYLALSWKNIDHEVEIRTQLYGNYNAPNILAAIAVGSFFGITEIHISKALEAYVPKNNRSQVINTDRNTLILDAYNANPGSLSLAIENFTAQEFENKILILGDMFELGKASLDEHQQIVDTLQKKSFKQVILAGKDFYKTRKDPSFLAFQTTEAVAGYLKDHPLSGNTILIKGSRGMQLETLVQHL